VFGRDTDTGVDDLDAHGMRGLVGGGADAEDHFTFFCELDRVAQEVERDLADANGVAVDAARGGVGVVEDQLDVLFSGDAGLEFEGALELLVEVEVDGFEDEFTGFDFGEIEDVVDDGEEGLAAEEEGVDEVLLLVVERGAEEEVSHADDAVERGADLVAHVGEEGAFGAVGGFGCLLGGEQLGVDGGEFGGARNDALFELVVELAEAFFAGGECSGLFRGGADLLVELGVGGVELGGAGLDEVAEAFFLTLFEIGGEPDDQGECAEAAADVEGDGKAGAVPGRADREGERGFLALSGAGARAHAEQVPAFLEPVVGGGGEGAGGGPVLALQAGAFEEDFEGNAGGKGVGRCGKAQGDGVVGVVEVGDACARAGPVLARVGQKGRGDEGTQCPLRRRGHRRVVAHEAFAIQHPDGAVVLGDEVVGGEALHHVDGLARPEGLGGVDGAEGAAGADPDAASGVFGGATEAAEEDGIIAGEGVVVDEAIGGGIVPEYVVGEVDTGDAVDDKYLGPAAGQAVLGPIDADPGGLVGVAADAGDSVGAEFAPDVTGLVDDEVINVAESGCRDAAYIEAVFGGAHPADFVAGGV